MRALFVLVALLLVSRAASADIGPPHPAPAGEDTCTVQRVCPKGLRCQVVHYQVNQACAARAKAQGMVRRCMSGGRNGGVAVFCPVPGARKQSAPLVPAFGASAAPSTAPAAASHSAPVPARSAPPPKAPAPAATVPPATTSHGCAGCAISPRGAPLGALALSALLALLAFRRRA